MLRHRTEALISLQEVSQALIAGDDLRKLALRITRYTAALCGADRAGLYVLEEDEIATVLASHGWDPARVPDTVPDEQLFGRQRLGRLLQRYAEPSLEELCEATFAHLHAFRADTPRFDDMTMLVVEIGD